MNDFITIAVYNR